MSRAERVMAIVRWGLLIAVTLVAARNVQVYWMAHGGDHAHAHDRYYCPMHPQIRAPDPGECPICHMRLELIPAGLGESAAVDAGAMPAGPEGLDAVMLSTERQQRIGLTTVEVVSKSIAIAVTAPASVEARDGSVVEARVRVPSFIERLVVRETGARVGRNQVLAWVYAPDVARVRDEIRVAQRWAGAAIDGGVAPSEELVAAGRRSLERLGVASSDVEVAMNADDAVPSVPLRAPGGGVITRFAASVGTFATPDTVLYEITDLSRVWVVASVPDRDLAEVHVGATVRFRAAESNAELEGRVLRVEPATDPVTRTARVRVEVPNRDLALRPGQVGSVAFDDAAADRLVVPRDAVVDTGRARYVFVQQGERFEPRTVEVGAVVGDEIVVLSGLAAGERVVDRGGFLLDSESRLSASLRPASAPRDAGVGAP